MLDVGLRLFSYDVNFAVRRDAAREETRKLMSRTMALKRANFIVLLLSIALLVACSSETDTTDTTIETKQGPVGKQAQQQIQNEACKSIGEHSSKDQTTTLENEPDVVYVATPQDVVDRMLKLAKVTKDDVVYDLGCGDGRVVVTAAKRFGCRAVGYDIDSKRIKESRENVMRNGVQHLVRIEQKDIFTLDLIEANVVFLYLLPELKT